MSGRQDVMNPYHRESLKSFSTDAGIRGFFFFAFAATALFIVYGSLVPLRYKPIPFHRAIQAFENLIDFSRTVSSGPAARADWITNLVLYVPMAFFGMGVLSRRGEFGARVFLKSAAVLALCLFWSMGVEFAQLYFPPRTASILDILAQILGSAVGLSLWWVFGDSAARVVYRIRFGKGKGAFLAGLTLYTLAYGLIALFPFDFAVSLEELHKRLASGRDALWAAPCRSALWICLGGSILEMASAVPLGILVAAVLPLSVRRRALATGLLAALFGVVLETAQLFMISGSAQGLSVFVRAAGAVLGCLLHDQLSLEMIRNLRGVVRPAVVLAVPLYVVVLAMAAGWRPNGTVDFHGAMRQWSKVRFIPFYYHYFTSELMALKSLLSQLAAYVPVSAMFWAWNLADPRGPRIRSAVIPTMLAFGCAALMEVLKLFLPGKHPDPTNVMIAAGGAFVAHRALGWLTLWVAAGANRS